MGLLIVALMAVNGLHLHRRLSNVVPFSKYLGARLTNMSSRIIKYLRQVRQISLKDLMTRSRLRLVLPLRLLLIIMVHRRHCTSRREMITLAAFVPIIECVILRRLRVMVASGDPRIELRSCSIQ